ncbi:DUF3077 domain-containing protein [Pseudomonas sp. CF161]|uniref:DUF3077 domain-containing protein n=1 Tax=Pseudomonas sp. CF161 TaxID=911241 RepID=UPI0009FE0B3C
MLLHFAQGCAPPYPTLASTSLLNLGLPLFHVSSNIPTREAFAHASELLRIARMLTGNAAMEKEPSSADRR